MAAVNPPAWMQSRSDHPAILYRRMLMALATGHNSGDTVSKGGVVPGYGNRLNVTGSASVLQSSVDTGLCVIPGTTGFGGSYFAYNDALVALTHDPADASQFRRDVVIAQVLDTAFGDASSAWQLAIVKGANSVSSPAPLPALPARSLQLAYVSIDPSITNLTGKVQDQRVWLGTANALRTHSTSRPTSPSPGTLVQDDDLQQVTSIYDGNAYRFVTDKGWQAYTPTHTGQGSATFSSNSGRWKQIGEKTAIVAITVTASAAGSGSSVWTISLPFTPARSGKQMVSGWMQSSGGQTAGFAFVDSGGSGAKFDKIKIPAGTLNGNLDDFTGANIKNGAFFLFEGVLEMV